MQAAAPIAPRFTEDGIPIRTLFIGGLSREVTDISLHIYFHSYGEVENVVIKSRRSVLSGRNNYRYAFVTFREAAAATKVLDQKLLRIKGRSIRVKSADSWIQPDYKKATTTPEVFNDHLPSILILNDDCLLHLFSFLSIKDQVNASLTCMRFRNVADIVFKQCKILDFKRIADFTLLETRRMLQLIGKYYNTVQYCRNETIEINKRSVEFLPRFCPNIENIVFENVTLPISTYKNLQIILKNLNSLSLKSCGITDDICEVLKCCVRLERLDLSNNYEITGKHLSKFSSLKQLALNFCGNFQPVSLTALCHTSKLEKLEIKCCDRLNATSFKVIALTQTELESLTISSSYEITDLSELTKLKMLKELAINFSSELPREFLENLVERKKESLIRLSLIGKSLDPRSRSLLLELTKLDHLEVPADCDDTFAYKIITKIPFLEHLSFAGCKNITTQGILKLVEQSKSLRVLDISYCRQFGLEFVFSLIDTLKNKMQTNTLRVIVGNTSILKYVIEQNEMYTQNREILQLSFDTSTNYSLIEDQDDEFLGSSDDSFGDLYDSFGETDSDDAYFGGFGLNGFRGLGDPNEYYINIW